jgi:hypothetical protein
MEAVTWLSLVRFLSGIGDVSEVVARCNRAGNKSELVHATEAKQIVRLLQEHVKKVQLSTP